MIETVKLKELVKSYDWDDYTLDLKDKLIKLIKEDSGLVCNCNLKANAELIGRIMEADADHRPLFYSDCSCENCKFMNNDEYEEPCKSCRNNYTNKFQAKPLPPHWVTLDNCSNEGIYCSECHAKIFDFTHKPQKKLSNFCPNCGANMRVNKNNG